MQPAICHPGHEARLHLYLAHGCPFCHRVSATLALTGLDRHVSVTWMINVKGEAGWEIAPDDDPLFEATSLRAVYTRLALNGGYVSSVPLLVDLSSRTLLSTSSTKMTRYFARGMNGAYPVACDLSPAHLVEQIDTLNAWLHDSVNRAVYKVGFATGQADYEAKAARLFHALDRLEARLSAQPYLFGKRLTESDLYLFATLIRFDDVYYMLFKCNYRKIAEYPALSRYLNCIGKLGAIAGTFDRRLIREHYFRSVMHVGGELRNLNPSGLVPVDFWKANAGAATTEPPVDGGAEAAAGMYLHGIDRHTLTTGCDPANVREGR